MDVPETAPEDPRLDALALILHELLQMMEQAQDSPAPQPPVPKPGEEPSGPEPTA